MECAQKSARTLGGLKAVLEDDTLHCEQMTSTRQAAREYSMKDEDYVEFGKWLEGGQGTRSDLNDVSEMVLEGKSLSYIAEHAGPQFIKYSSGIMRQKLYVQKAKARPEIEVMCFWGGPGTGKTRAAVKLAMEWEAKTGQPWYKHTCDGSWFDGYDGEKFVIIDDFNSNIEFSRFLQMLDRYSCTVAVKGAMMAFPAEKIVITSNKHPKEWYSDTTYNVGQLARRIHHIRKFKKREADDAPVVWNDDSDVEMDEDE